MSEIVIPKIFRGLDEAHRYKVMYGGRGSAKSWTCAIKLLLLGVQKPMRILCTRELQKSIKQSVHKLLSDQIYAMGLQNFYEIQQQGINGKNGTEFIFMGVKHNPEEIKSTEGIDICWIEEAHSLTERSWEIIDPTIRKKGSEIWVTYNTRFKFDYVHKHFVVDKPPRDSWVQLVNHSDNKFFNETTMPEQMAEMKERDYENYLHIWEGQLKKLANGAVFGKQILEVDKDRRQTFIQIQKNCEVDTYWDLGKNDETCCWFVQEVGKEYRFIDYIQGRLEDVDHYVREVKRLDYNYGTHYMPHDADHDRLGMERNIRQQFEDGGIKPIEVVPVISHKNTAIQLAREIFPNCWFHKGEDNRGQRVEKGYEALCNYRYKYNDENSVFSQKPLHDWASNGSDAFMQFAQADKEISDGWSSELNYNTNGIV